jgi:hypothetical protein
MLDLAVVSIDDHEKIIINGETIILEQKLHDVDFSKL